MRWIKLSVIIEVVSVTGVRSLRVLATKRSKVIDQKGETPSKEGKIHKRLS